MRVRRDNLLHVTRGTNCIFFMQTLIPIYIKERVLAGSMTFNRRHKWNDYCPGPVSLEIYWEVNVSPSKCFRQLKLITYVPCKKVYCWMPGCLATIIAFYGALSARRRVRGTNFSKESERYIS